jgi:FlaA1/EpsC-like NDP-sugar epimerase
MLITGGTGFLGRRLAMALKRRGRVVLAARSHKQNLLAQELTGCPAVAMDVTNLSAVRDTFTEVRPAVVIHAAASKYVDIAERQPMECVDVNVVGSQNVARAAVDRGVPLVVGISTDKAAPPVSNTYGLCKALMERMFCAMNGKSETRFICVRPGNIPWSTGSFLPIWKRMHDAEGVIGTTGPEMTRFFSLPEEVVQLVTTAIDHAGELQGKVVTRAMKAAQIGAILELWVAHKGGSWKRIEGRPGERQHEFLVGEPELLRTREVIFGGVKHYVLSTNELAGVPLASPISSEGAERFTDRELLDIINNPPPEER